MNIKFSAFTKLKDDEIGTFGSVVYSKMNGVEVYAPFPKNVTALLPVTTAYDVAYTHALGGGDKPIHLKREARKALESQLTRIGKDMDGEWTDNSHDFDKKEAGFTLVKAPERDDTNFVDAPTNLKAVNDERRGVINVSWTRARRAKTYAIEVLDSEGNWRNGLYCDRTRYQFTDLQRGSQLTIRLKTIGPNSLTSEYTEPVSVFVD
jgi:hypothetical protein